MVCCSSGTIIHLDINVVLVPDEGASLSCSHTIIIKIKQLNEAATIAPNVINNSKCTNSYTCRYILLGAIVLYMG